MRILHVVEVDGGGVWDAVYQYVYNLPEAEHVVAGTDANYLAKFGSGAPVVHLSGGLRQRRKRVEQLVEEFHPDVLHAHSSFAGLTCRIARVGGRPILYQPHAFYFSNESLGRPKRLIYWIAEKLLARRTAGFVAVSSHEADQMAQLDRRVPVFRLRNTSRLTAPHEQTPHGGFRVVMSGRASAQKSPEVFAAIADLVRANTSEVEFVWLGDGEPDHRQRLEASGVHVSGWLDQGALAYELAQAQVYLHTAAYEGFPQSILDAAVVGTAMLVRDRPYARDLDVEKFVDPEEAAAILRRWHADPAELDVHRARSRAVPAEFSSVDQRRELRDAYDQIGGRAKP